MAKHNTKTLINCVYLGFDPFKLLTTFKKDGPMLVALTFLDTIIIPFKN